MGQKIYNIGIRLEDKYFESRTPLTPSDVYDLLNNQHANRLKVYVEKSKSRPVESTVEYSDDSGESHKIKLKPRCFTDDDYNDAGAILVEQFPADCKVILGIKEIPHKDRFNKKGERVIKNGFENNKTYAYFSHTFKWQESNEEMFLEMIEKGCTLIDYEMILENVSEFKFNKRREALAKFLNNSDPLEPKPKFKFERTVYFGKHAGIVGAINSLWVLGLRLKEGEGIKTPFLNINQAITYRSNQKDEAWPIADHHKGIHDYQIAKQELLLRAKELASFEAPLNCPPFIIGITGKSKERSEAAHSLVLGHSAIGAKEVLDIFGAEEISLETLTSDSFKPDRKRLYVVYFDKDATKDDFCGKYLPKLTVLLNCMTWDAVKENRINGGRIVTRQLLRELYKNNKQGWHRVIGDISCDPGGSVEPSVDIYSDEPYYIYHPLKDTDDNLRWYNDDKPNEHERKTLFNNKEICSKKNVTGIGPVIMSVTNLPCELPKEASRGFSYMLKDYVFDFAKISNGPPTFNDLNDNFEISRSLKRAVMIYKGKVTPDYAYLVDKQRYNKLYERNKDNPCVWI